MFSRKKKKAQPQAAIEALPPPGTPPLNNAVPQKTKKSAKKDKKKDGKISSSAESPGVTPKKKGFRFGRKGKTPASPYSEASSIANDSVGDCSSLYQSEASAKLNTTQGSIATTSSQSIPAGSADLGSPFSPASGQLNDSLSSSYQEQPSHTGRGYQEREMEYWDESEVLHWLTDQGLDYFVELFEGCEIDGIYLLDVTDDDLVELEVDDASLRRRLLDAVSSARNKASSAFPTLDQQLSALGQTDSPQRTNSTKQANISEASTVPASDMKDSPRDSSPPPKLALRRPTPEFDSDSEFDFDSDEMDNPLEDLPDNSKRKQEQDEAESSPRRLVGDGRPRQNGSKEVASPRGLSEEVGSPRGRLGSSPSPGKSRSQPDVPDSPMKTPKKLPSSPRSDPDTPTSPSERKAVGSKSSENPQSPLRLLDRRSGATRSRSQSVVTRWSEKDVIAWLQETQLDHLKNHFMKNQITGKQLVNVDMQLLDSMGITSEDDRELLLAKLYELNNPSANMPEKDLLSALNNTSGYEHKKYLAAMKVLQSSDSEEIQLLPPETLIVPDSFSGSSRSPSTASDAGKGDEKKRKGGLSKLKDVISPKRRESRDYNLIQVWTDILRSGVTTVALRLTETEDTKDLIRLCLEQLGLIEDWRLYCILDSVGSLSDRKDRGFERLMEDNECPVLVQQDWPDKSPRHFELRQRPAQGGSIKIVLRLDEDKPKGKLLPISLSTPANEVIRLGLLRFGLTNADLKKYCLLEVEKSGDLNLVDGDSIPLQLDSHAFVLCESSKVESQLGLNEEEEATSEDRRRANSLTSKASSKVSFSGVSFGSSTGSDLLASLRFDDDKLTKLEEEMATIEESLNPGKVETKGGIRPTTAETTSPRPPASLVPPANQTATQDSKDQEAIIRALHQDNEILKERNKQLSAFQGVLNQLEQSYKQSEAESKQRIQDKKEILQSESDEPLPKSVLDYQTQLRQLGEEMSNKKLNILKIQQQQKQLQGRNTSESPDSDMHLVELECRVAAEESAMLNLQQQQAQMLSSMELALADRQAAVAKRKLNENSQALFSMLDAKHSYSLHLVRPSRVKDEKDLSLSAFQSGRGAVVQNGRLDESVQVGDSLVAVSGQNVLNLPLADIKAVLSRHPNAEMVVMRTGEAGQLSKARQEIDRLTDEMEDVTRDNETLQQELNRLKSLEPQAKQASQLQMTVQQLNAKLTESERRVEELEHQEQSQGNKDQVMRQMQDDKHKLQMEVIKLQESLCRLEDSLDEKRNELSAVRQERDNAVDELMSKAEDKTTSSSHLINEALEDGLPLWEALKTASKAEILEVMRNELEEAGRQKEYLDQLYTLMLEKAPSLLDDMEEDFDASELSDNEEFC